MYGRNRYGTTRYGASGAVGVFYKALSVVVSASGSIARTAGKGISATEAAEDVPLDAKKE